MIHYRRKHLERYFFLGLVVFALCIGVIATAQDVPATPTSITIAGTIQSVLGCANDWAPECDKTFLTYDAEDDVWQGSFDLPAGDYEYKAALNGTWDESYGAATGSDNVKLSLPADSTVSFFYDNKSHWVTDNVNSVIAVAIGSFQSELGCASDFDPACLRSWLQDEDANGVYSFSTTSIPVGDYEAQVALNQTLDEVYGAKGELNGANIAFNVPTEGFKATFGFSPARKLFNVRVTDPQEVKPTVEPTLAAAGITGLTVTVPGSYNAEIGCPDDIGAEGDWAPDCDLILMNDDDGDGVYVFVSSSIPAGSYEAKVAIGLSWSENYGADGVKDGPNIPFEVPVDFAQVTFTFDSATKVLSIAVDGSITGSAATAPGTVPIVLPSKDVVQPEAVTITGTIQTAMGCESDWAPDCDKTFLTYDEADGIWQGSFDLPAGDYEYKVAINKTWDENYGGNADAGGANVVLSLAADTAVKFYYDPATHWVADSVGDVIATAPGSYQDEIGCPGEWQPDCLRSWLQDPDGDGIAVFATDAIPAGDYEVKVALNEAWTVNYGADGVQDGPNIPFTVPADGTPVAFVYNSASHILQVGVGAMPAAGPVAKIPDLGKQSAQWVTRDTIAWDVGDLAEQGATFKLVYAVEAGLEGSAAGFDGGSSIDLTYDPAGLSQDVLDRFPQLSGYAALKIGADDLGVVPGILKSQAGVVAFDTEGQALDGTGLQIPGVLDDLYVYDGALGVSYDGDVPTLSVWAPTAQRVRLKLFDDSAPDTEATTVNMTLDRATGVWSVTGDASWTGKYYLYEVKVYAPSTQQIETNLVTDPYSFSLSTNSLRSQIVNLSDASLMPEGWNELVKPPLEAPEDAVIYELHVRDFSINDQTVPEEDRGTFKAFTITNSNGMQHLISLAQAGLTHIHLLPAFDSATINENASERIEPDAATLAGFPADSDQQQATIDPVRDQDGYNWGYDPFHYTVPEGSYSTNPDGTTRIVEFREMVQALNQNGLRVVMDVVYNHTNSSGQGEKSVLDQIVPGYYHRLNSRGLVETSTCCQNTATEHRMMEKLMIDSLVTWATQYKVDGFRFDLMGHHMRSNIEHVRQALDALTLENSGVDGQSIYIYGEGWDFGEVKDNALGVNATQLNMGGTGVGTFNDRLRDAVRGGSPFGGFQDQGFAEGLFVDPNGITVGSPDEQKTRLGQFIDQIQLGLAGNLSGYSFMNSLGNMVTGADISYNGLPAGYTLDPQENIVYVSAHDNETLFDAIQMKAPAEATVADRVRMQNLANSVVMFSQGVPFFHAGDDILRSKSGDRNSYNSGDWFNRLDFTYESNNWGVGLPPLGDNKDNYPILQPLLANPDLRPTQADIMTAMTNFEELLQIRKSSVLFRLRTGDDVQNRVTFLNVGPEAVPGLIVMQIVDGGDLDDIDPNYDMVVVVFNSSSQTQTFSTETLTGTGLELHPIQVNSNDPVVQTSTFDSASGTFSVPGRTTAVFVLKQG